MRKIFFISAMIFSLQVCAKSKEALEAKKIPENHDSMMACIHFESAIQYAKSYLDERDLGRQSGFVNPNILRNTILSLKGNMMLVGDDEKAYKAEFGKLYELENCNESEEDLNLFQKALKMIGKM
jgi:hypothetical protein